MKKLLFILLVAIPLQAQEFALRMGKDVETKTAAPIVADTFDSGVLPENSTWVVQYELIFRLWEGKGEFWWNRNFGPPIWQNWDDCPIDGPGGTRYDSVYNLYGGEWFERVDVAFQFPEGSTLKGQFNYLSHDEIFDTTVADWVPGDYQWQWLWIGGGDCYWVFVPGYATTYRKVNPWPYFEENKKLVGLTNSVGYQDIVNGRSYECDFFHSYRGLDTNYVRLKMSFILSVGGTAGHLYFLWSPIKNGGEAVWVSLKRGSTLWMKRIS
jgi:hypothetical protein